MKKKNKLEFSSYLGNSLLENESNNSLNRSEGEDRWKLFDQSKNSESIKKSSVVKRPYENLSGQGEDESSSSLLESKIRHQRKHSNQHDDIVNKDISDKFIGENVVKEPDGHILINEKFNIEIDNSYGKKQSSSKNEESKKSSNKNTIKSENKNIEIGCRSFNLDDLMVLRNDAKSDYEEIKHHNSVGNNHKISKPKNNLNFEVENRVQSKDKRDERKSIKSTENNNLDLNSVRYRSNNFSEEKQNVVLDIKNEEANNPELFSDLSKWFHDTKKQFMSNTLDEASLAKLRRMIGSEKLIREYRTSEESSHFQYIPHYDESHIQSEIFENIEDQCDHQDKDSLKELKYKLNADLDNENEHMDFMHNLNDKSEPSGDKTEDFMGTNDLIDLFEREGIKKTLESGDYNCEEKLQTQALFERNPFKDFTMTKIHEMLINKDYDEMQEIRKMAIDYRAAIENKLLNKIRPKESPKTIKSRKLDIEKWVDQELNEVNNEDDKDRMRQKTIQTICDTNIHTERIFNLIQRINLTESNVSSNQHNQERMLEKKTIDELLKTDSDTSPNDDRIEFDINKIHKEQSIEEVSCSEAERSLKNQQESLDKTDDMEVWETTQELLNKNFGNILKTKYGIQNLDTEESK